MQRLTAAAISATMMSVGQRLAGEAITEKDYHLAQARIEMLKERRGFTGVRRVYPRIVGKTYKRNGVQECARRVANIAAGRVPANEIMEG